MAISLGQLLPRAEAVVVTTPHRAAQQVAVRAATMARKTNMRLLGVVENMAYMTREDGSREELFGSGGGEALAVEVEAPLLGRIPFDPRLGALADQGEPIVLVEPEAEVSRAIVALAEAIADTKREAGHRHRQAPPARSQLSTEDVHGRLRALGFEEREAGVLADHFLDAEARSGTGGSRPLARRLARHPHRPRSVRPARAGGARTRATSAGRGAARSAT